jgi:hypothetical protein
MDHDKKKPVDATAIGNQFRKRSVYAEQKPPLQKKASVQEKRLETDLLKLHSKNPTEYRKICSQNFFFPPRKKTLTVTVKNPIRPMCSRAGRYFSLKRMKK